MAVAAIGLLGALVTRMLGEDATPMAEATPVTDSAAEPSTDIDAPTPLEADVIEGFGIAEAISYYYVFGAGPGEVTVAARARNEAGVAASAIGVAIQKMNGVGLANISLGYTDQHMTVSDSFPLGRRENLLMRVDLDPATVDYRITLGGAVHTTP